MGTTTPAPVFGRRGWWVEPLFCRWEWLPIPRMVPRTSVTGAVRCVFHGRLQAALEEEGRISSAPRKAPQPTPTLLLLLLVVIPRLLCYVHPKSALVRRRSWHRKMKIPSTSLAWMVRPNPRKKQTKEKVQMMCLYINCVTYATNSNINMQVYMYIHTHTQRISLCCQR